MFVCAYVLDTKSRIESTFTFELVRGHAVGHSVFSPPDLRGWYVCQFWTWGGCLPAKTKYAICINNLYQKYITRGNVCQVGGTPKTDKPTLLRKSVAYEFWSNEF